MQNELDKETATQALIQQIRGMSDRIEKLIGIANKCVQDGLHFPLKCCLETEKYGYNHDFVFEIRLIGNGYNGDSDDPHVALLHFKPTYNDGSKGEITHLGFYVGDNRCLVFDHGFHKVIVNNACEVVNERLFFKNSFYYERLVQFLYEFPRLEKAFYKWYEAQNSGRRIEEHTIINLDLTFDGVLSEADILDFIYKHADELGIEQFELRDYKCKER